MPLRPVPARSGPKPDKYAPKHRSAPAAVIAKGAPKRVLRTTVLLSSVAVAATGVSISTGVLAQAPQLAASADALAPVANNPLSEIELVERDDQVSRSDRRSALDPGKQASLAPAEGPATTRTEDLSDADPRDIARALLPEYGFSVDQFGCLDALYVSESNWRVNADNPSSSAYGIPQALTQLHDLPADYMTSAEAQIRWGLEYITNAYGSPCSAWSFKQGHNWY